MITKEIQVKIKHGLHMRPATRIVHIAGGADGGVTLQKSGQTADAKSIMAIMMLETKKGDILEVTAKDEAVISSIEEILQNEEL